MPQYCPGVLGKGHASEAICEERIEQSGLACEIGMYPQDEYLGCQCRSLNPSVKTRSDLAAPFVGPLIPTRAKSRKKRRQKQSTERALPPPRTNPSPVINLIPSKIPPSSSKEKPAPITVSSDNRSNSIFDIAWGIDFGGSYADIPKPASLGYKPEDYVKLGGPGYWFSFFLRPTIKLTEHWKMGAKLSGGGGYTPELVDAFSMSFSPTIGIPSIGLGSFELFLNGQYNLDSDWFFGINFATGLSSKVFRNVSVGAIESNDPINSSVAKNNSGRFFSYPKLDLSLGKGKDDFLATLGLRNGTAHASFDKEDFTHLGEDRGVGLALEINPISLLDGSLRHALLIGLGASYMSGGYDDNNQSSLLTLEAYLEYQQRHFIAKGSYRHELRDLHNSPAISADTYSLGLYLPFKGAGILSGFSPYLIASHNTNTQNVCISNRAECPEDPRIIDYYAGLNYVGIDSPFNILQLGNQNMTFTLGVELLFTGEGNSEFRLSPSLVFSTSNSHIGGTPETRLFYPTLGLSYSFY